MMNKMESIHELLGVADSALILPALPANAVEALNMTRQSMDAIDLDRVRRIVESDPVIAARVVRMANSPVFGGACRITAISRAIMQVGLVEIISLLNFYYLSQITSDLPEVDGFSREDFWMHSLATAMAARKLGGPEGFRCDDPEAFYLAGLLHDFGKIVFATNRPEEYSKCLKLAQETGAPLHEIERERFGADHAVVAGALLEQWGLPEAILSPVKFHHQVEASQVEETRLRAGILELANEAVKAMGLPDGAASATGDVKNTWLAREGTVADAFGAGLDDAMCDIFADLQKKLHLLSGFEQTGEDLDCVNY